ncbi:D-alanyl-D-alanine carboxypeptidase family protein [Geomicrobium sp. JCM 19039]|uniref:D-alanyl-D-alanine carboxypeptidase family protein n=1 Tax=Geomicrobium sp. JCM 19039 TaxID=1460636 RepID=UPI00045F3B59|nr:D-alanyl-D-alanine carboxypeptidase family protein [Geomicrobium sp. JCM 19039]GAK12856.1 D-alanyl-D-alanine carboxypeptidase [Geomicrobium sp. JCM 19039]
MIRKGALLFVAVVLLFTSGAKPTLAVEESMIDDAKSAILIEADTGEVLMEKNADQALPPASMTKIMTMLLIMEAIDEGELEYEDMVSTSEKAASMGGSQVFLEVGEEMSVRDMLKAIAVASGNDASVAMAEHLAGTEEDFVEMMNDKAKELDLKNTTFHNTNGLPSSGHETSAYDLAKIARELLKHEEITTFTSIYEDYLRQGTEDEFWLVNTNRLIKFYEGMDGLKTGYTSESKYGLTATAKRDDMRLIAVVMGAETPQVRNNTITDLMNHGFSNYQVESLFDKGAAVTTVPVEKGTKNSVVGKLDNKISLLLKKNQESEEVEERIQMNDVKAPVAEGETIGEFQLVQNGEPVASSKIVAAESVDSASWWELFKRSALKIIGVNTDDGAISDES